MTVFLTVISGVLTFALGQIIVRLVIEPVQELKKTIGLNFPRANTAARCLSESGRLEPRGRERSIE